MDVTQKFLQRRNEALEHQVDHENDVIPPALYRVYKSTVQRQIPNYLALSSHAAFLVLLDGESQVIAWIGSQCEEEDINVVKELGVEVMIHDYGHATKTIPIVHEQDDISSPLMEAFLDIFDVDGSVYNNKLTITERRKPLENSSVSIGLVIPPKNLKDVHLFELKETSYAHPDVTGLVPRIPFPSLERNSIVYLNIGDQWDLWFSKGLSNALIDLTIKFVENLIETQLSRTVGSSFGSGSSSDATSIKALVVQYLQMTNQGQERQCFRRPIKIFTDFQPFDDVKTIIERRREEKEKEEAEAAKHYGDEHPPLQSALRPLNDSTVTRQGLSTGNNVSFAQKMGVDMSPIIPKSATFWNTNAVAQNNGSNTVGKSANPMKEHSDHFPKKEAPPHAPVLIRVNDIDAITPDLLQLNDSWNIPLHDRRILLQNSSLSPEILLGWQIEIDDGLYSGVFVVIGTKKSTFRKTYFHLCAGSQDEFWVRLKRGNNKRGVAFRPLRKVAYVDAVGLAQGASASSEPQYGVKGEAPDLDEGELALQLSAVKNV